MALNQAIGIRVQFNIVADIDLLPKDVKFDIVLSTFWDSDPNAMMKI